MNMSNWEIINKQLTGSHTLCDPVLSQTQSVI